MTFNDERWSKTPTTTIKTILRSDSMNSSQFVVILKNFRHGICGIIRENSYEEYIKSTMTWKELTMKSKKMSSLCPAVCARLGVVRTVLHVCYCWSSLRGVLNQSLWRDQKKRCSAHFGTSIRVTVTEAALMRLEVRVWVRVRARKES